MNCSITEAGKSRVSIPTQSDVRAVQFDTCNQNRLLLADGNSIKEYVDGKLILKAGDPFKTGFRDNDGTNARFNKITDFLQTDCNEWIIVDSENHCLRRFHTSSLWVTTVYGSCTDTGSRDGTYKEARFSYPQKMIAENVLKTKAWILELNQLRTVNLTTGEVKGSDGSYAISGRTHLCMAWHGRDLIVGTRSKIYRYDIRQGRYFLIHDGFAVDPTDMAAISQTNIIIISNRNSVSVVMLDAKTGQISQECWAETCNLQSQLSVTYSMETSSLIYGLKNKIVIFTGKTLKN